MCYIFNCVFIFFLYNDTGIAFKLGEISLFRRQACELFPLWNILWFGEDGNIFTYGNTLGNIDVISHLSYFTYDFVLLFD